MASITEDIAVAVPDPKQTVATVNGVPILLEAVLARTRDRMPQGGHGGLSPQRMAEIRGEVLGTLIIQEVLYQEARRKKVLPKPEETAAEVAKIKARFPTEAAFQAGIAERGLSPEEIEDGARRHLAIQRLTEREVHSKIRVTDEEMREYYKNNPDQFFMPEQIRLRIILLAVDPSSPQVVWDEAKEEAEALAERARGEEDFAELARELSADLETRGQGGDTGLLHQGRLPFPELETVAFGQEVGSVGDPVGTLRGYVVYRVEEKRPAEKRSYEQLNKDLFRKEMEDSAAKRKLKEWVDGLREKAEVEFFEVKVGQAGE